MRFRFGVLPFLLASAVLHGALVFVLSLSSPAIDNVTVVQIEVEYARTRAPNSKARVANNSHAPKKPKAANIQHSSNKEHGDDSISVSGSEVGIQATYPRLSRVLGESGQVTIEIMKDALGEIQPPRVQVSSGYPRLNQSALEATENALKQGSFVSFLENHTQMQIHFIFKLTNSAMIVN